jgi:hypothetical protein
LLQVHPTEPGLWVYAAAWEFEANGNPAAARALMQQGLRMCRYSEKMWLDYFDMVRRVYFLCCYYFVCSALVTGMYDVCINIKCAVLVLSLLPK